jgi:multidrug efflux pump
MREKLTQFIGVVMADPAVENVVGFTGGGSTNTRRVFVQLKPLKDRNVSAGQVINRLRGRLARIPGATLFLQAVQPHCCGSAPS